LYNAALADRKESYQRLGQSITYLDQQNRLPAFKEGWAEYKPLGSQALQATLKRVDPLCDKIDETVEHSKITV
jgi:putative transposase